MYKRQPFQATHADREVNRIASAPELVRWTSPSGVCLDLHLPATVYPPREDTDLLISALGPHHLRQGSSWLEIGCGSGVVSWWAATNGCRVTACDINPLAVATTRGLIAQHGLSARVHEGGPGPAVDGGLDQWGGEQLYDTVVWNTPYLSSNVLEAGALGPMEEAALTDTDDQGLVPRLLELIAAGRLLNERGTAFVTVSSRGIGLDAQAVAWRHGLAMRSVASTEFGDGETLQVLAIWRPYVGSPVVSLPTTKRAQTMRCCNTPHDRAPAFVQGISPPVEGVEVVIGRRRRARCSPPGSSVPALRSNTGPLTNSESGKG